MYDEWLDSGKQTVTSAGNVRAPSRVDICDMVSRAWDGISEEMIAKSFICCGQAKNGIPDDVTCLKDGNVAASAMEEVKKFWNFEADQFEEEDSTQVLEEDSDGDVFVVDEDEGNDETDM